MKQLIVKYISCLAMALHGYDQGLMSYVNKNELYRNTMNIPKDSSLVGTVIASCYLGCVAGSIMASYWADWKGRKSALWISTGLALLGGGLMFIPGLFLLGSDVTWNGASFWVMVAARFVLGIGMGGITLVGPVHKAELSEGNARGSTLAKDFRVNVGSLCTAFIINLSFNRIFQEDSWAWRVPILLMECLPMALGLVTFELPESPRWLISKGEVDQARQVISELYGNDRVEQKMEELQAAHREVVGAPKCLLDKLCCGSGRFHPHMITIMVQFSQALTGYGAILFYGSQVFQLLGLEENTSDFAMLSNYVFYFVATFASTGVIDHYGRRALMLWGSCGLSLCFFMLWIIGTDVITGSHTTLKGILGFMDLTMSTLIYGSCWLTTGVSYFIITFLAPIGFNCWKHRVFVIFAVSNLVVALFVWLFLPETGGRSFQENQQFFVLAKERGTPVVSKVDINYLALPKQAVPFNEAEAPDDPADPADRADQAGVADQTDQTDQVDEADEADETDETDVACQAET
ncbi:general substrate transporter [Daldinia sp. FL1419]|nr:general substrate transporter [Daldinia sp. FL1419]